MPLPFHFLPILLLPLLGPAPLPREEDPHLSGQESAYIPIRVNGNGYARQDKPLSLSLNLRQLYPSADFRLEEVNAEGELLAAEVPFQLDRPSGARDSAELTFMLEGITGPQDTRYYRFHTDATTTGDPGPAKTVKLDSLPNYLGEKTYRVSSARATWLFHSTSAGFAGLLDKDGNDWISFAPNQAPADGSRGRYRGIPNLAPADFHPGRPEGKKPARILADGPIRVSFLSETDDGQWKCRWDIYPRYAQMTLLEKGPQPYWILYEGTPGGSFNERDYWVRSDGTRELLQPYFMPENQWSGQLPFPKWVYFGDKDLKRVLYMVHHEDYPHADVFWHFGEGSMTVFGFGRGPDSGRNWQQLTQVPAHLTVGFAEENGFSEVKAIIDDAYRPLDIRVGKPVGKE